MGPGVQEELKYWSSTIFRKYSESAISLKAAFEAPESSPTKGVLQLIGPKGDFDMQHMMQSRNLCCFP